MKALVRLSALLVLLLPLVGVAQEKKKYKILYISQSAYWVYLLHLPLVGLFAWLLVLIDMPAIVKFAIVFSATTLVCFLSYHYLVQRTWVSRFLHGRRFDLDWPWRARRAVAA